MSDLGKSGSLENFFSFVCLGVKSLMVAGCRISDVLPEDLTSLVPPAVGSVNSTEVAVNFDLKQLISYCCTLICICEKV